MSAARNRIAILVSIGLAVLFLAALAIFLANRQPPGAANGGATAQDRGGAADKIPEKANSLEGEWHSVAVERNGKKVVAEDARDLCIVIKSDEFIVKSVAGKGKERKQKFTLKPGSPNGIDIVSQDGPESEQTSAAIYALKKDRLTLCYSLTDATKRPTEFKTQDGDGLILIELERVATKKTAAKDVVPHVREFTSVLAEAQDADNEFWMASEKAKSRDEKDKATAAKAVRMEQLANRCLELAEKSTNTKVDLAALFWAASHAPDTEAGRKAYAALCARVVRADLDALGEGIRTSQARTAHVRGIAPAVMERAQQNPKHAQTALLLATVCTMTRPNEDEAPPTIYAEAADLIADKYAASPDIAHFCEGLGGSASWSLPYERHLRSILQVNRDRWVRCMASYALASIVQSAAEDRQIEAASLFERFVAEFDGKHSYRFQGMEGQLRDEAKLQLAELRSRALGMPAQDIAGVDLDDRPMKLSDYRGRAVLMNFWATWCFPCMKLIPHELEVVKAFAGQPFDIVGVNSDSDIPKARDAVVQTKVTWRSFRDRIDGKATITSQWKVVGYPTLYLIDHHGTIRKRWIGSPPMDELMHMTRVLVDAARRNVPKDAMQPVVAALRLPAAKANPVAAPAVVAPRASSGFLEKAHRNPDGSESKYFVFVPQSADGVRPFPAILSLHGSGSRGSDGQLAIQHGLAKAIRAKNEDFPFIVVFPQAREGEDWLAESAGGQRAIAILDQVRKDYRIDADRISLTGVSMGGHGTWSLAMADPKRWAAIVPICHGGDTKSAARLKELPCWCFHGDADKMIPVQQSREMVQAIKDSGGRPLYHEFVGVGHNDSADRAYERPELFEWMLLQNRGKR